ncbi:MAG: 4Fe-4S cluster-binding domain-containing protein [Clostridiales bacterium]|nr:4Fe-4S cluster-binding domain-containing protein [Clostridiales bacterium]
MNCSLCPRKCGTDRHISKGYCGVGENFRIARSAPHFWEEPCLSEGGGSGAVFFSGCNLGCVYCQNEKISRGCFGRDVTDKELIKIFDRLVESGVNNLNLVTPSHYAGRLSSVLRQFNSPVPVVYNTSSYDTVDSLRRLEGLVDIYLPDIKYYDSEISLKYSFAVDYFDVAAAAVKEMYRQVGLLETDDNAIAKKGIIIRHMVLPGNVSQALKIIDWLGDNFPPETMLSIMRQYTPCGKALDMPPINRTVSDREYAIVKKAVLKAGFLNCFFQQKTAAGGDFIPDFDLTGII